MDNVSREWEKKLIAIGLCGVIRTSDVNILSRFPGIFNFFVSTLAVVEKRGNHLGYDFFVDDSGGEEEEDSNMPPFERERIKLYHSEPSNKLNLRSLILSSFEQLKSIIGKNQFESLFKSIDPSLLQQFHQPN